MPAVLQHKVVAALPGVLEANSIYYVRVGSGFDLYVTNDQGTVVAYPMNQSGGGGGVPGVVEVDVNLGSRSTSPTQIVVVDADALATSRAIAWMIGPGPGRDADEAEEPFAVTAVPSAGSVTLFVCPLIGPVHGTWRVGYQILNPL
jgi:hypothetical protein